LPPTPFPSLFSPSANFTPRQVMDSETRNRILEATQRLMEERRGQGVRMRDIADAATLSRQAVYDYFGSRTKLLVATAITQMRCED
jgi:AcrR family transcriptional regulator